MCENNSLEVLRTFVASLELNNYREYEILCWQYIIRLTQLPIMILNFLFINLNECFEKNEL